MFINYTAQGERKFIRVMDAGERGIRSVPSTPPIPSDTDARMNPFTILFSAKNLTVDYFLNGTKRDALTLIWSLSAIKPVFASC